MSLQKTRAQITTEKLKAAKALIEKVRASKTPNLKHPNKRDILPPMTDVEKKAYIAAQATVTRHNTPDKQMELAEIRYHNRVQTNRDRRKAYKNYLKENPEEVAEKAKQAKINRAIRLKPMRVIREKEEALRVANKEAQRILRDAKTTARKLVVEANKIAGMLETQIKKQAQQVVIDAEKDLKYTQKAMELDVDADELIGLSNVAKARKLYNIEKKKITD